MGTEDLLILRRPEFDDRFAALAERLGEDAALREMYVRDPARVIANEVFGDAQIPSAEISRGNRLLFGLLTNDGFMQWVARYQEDVRRSALAATDMDDPELALRTYLAITDRNKLHEDLVVAVAEYADAELIAALTWGGHAQIPEEDARVLLRSGDLRFTPDVAVDIETFIYAVAAVIAFGVAVVAVLIAVPADEPNGAVVSRVDVQNVARQLAEQLEAHARELRASGALRRVSPGHVGLG